MANYDATNYSYYSIQSNFEVGAALIGAVAGCYFSSELSSLVADLSGSEGLLKFVKEEHGITHLASAFSGLLGGYFSGKVLGRTTVGFKKLFS